MQDSFSDFDQRYGVLYKEMELVLIQSEQRSELSLAPNSIQKGCVRFLSDISFDISQPACLEVQFFGRGFEVEVTILSVVKLPFDNQKAGYELELLITPEIALKARILLQLAEIVHYRNCLNEKGQTVTIDEAAAQWIEQYAAGFAEEFDRHINSQ